MLLIVELLLEFSIEHRPTYAPKHYMREFLESMEIFVFAKSPS